MSYNHMQLEPDEIHIPKLLPAQDDGQIRAVLHHVHFSERGGREYSALSYTLPEHERVESRAYGPSQARRER